VRSDARPKMRANMGILSQGSGEIRSFHRGKRRRVRRENLLTAKIAKKDRKGRKEEITREGND